MKRRISFKQAIVWAGILTFWGLVVFSGNILNRKQEEKMQAIVHQPYQTMFKTIPNSENALGLIGYELHEDGTYNDGQETYVTYNAVVKEVDSQKDNYKALCRDVVTDIIKTCGNEHVIVNIYDSFEAYTLAVSSERQFKFLKKEEEDAINSHRIATYDNTAEYADESRYLAFYPDAGNGLTEREIYSSL